jgi:SAM-dependent methyltransferase
MSEGGTGGRMRVGVIFSGRRMEPPLQLWEGALRMGNAGRTRGDRTFHLEQISRSGTVAGMFEVIAKQAAQRYRSCGITAWQFAQGKLLGDPVYRAVLDGPWLKRGGTVIDLGCGQGLMLAAIAEARAAASEAYHAGETFAEPMGMSALPRRLVGIELRAKVAAIARRALAGEAEISAADARSEALPVARTILVFDVLHMMPAADQEALLRGLVAALEPGGTLLLREADADAGWRFQAVNFANRMKALAFGYSSKGFCFRTAASWRALLESRGLSVEVWPMGKGTPYGNVLLVGTKAGDV